MLRAYNNVAVPSFMYGTAWKKEATAELVIMAVAAGFKAIDTANQLIHYQEALVGEALKSLQQQGSQAEQPLSSDQVYSSRGPGSPDALRSHRRSHNTGSAILCQLIGSPSHRLCGLLRFARAFFAAGFGRSGLGSLVGDGSALSIGENENDRRQQHHGRATYRAL